MRCKLMCKLHARVQAGSSKQRESKVHQHVDCNDVRGHVATKGMRECIRRFKAWRVKVQKHVIA